MVNELIVVTAGYFGVLVMAVMVVGFLQGGLFLPWLRTRTSRDRSVLVQVKGGLKDRFAVGRITEGFLIYTLDKKKRRLTMEQGCTFKAMGVHCIVVDDERNAIQKTDFSTVTGYDAVKNENLHVRALTAPKLDDNTLKIVLILVIVCIGITALTLFMMYQLSQQVGSLGSVATVAPR